MASKTTALTAKNLEALGLERLAELLMEFGDGDAAAKRRLRLELAATRGPSEMANEVRKRLSALAKARSPVDRRRAGRLADDLDAQRRAIVEIAAKGGASDAHDLIWQFMALANPTLDRCGDSVGVASHAFGLACRDIGDLAQQAEAEPESLAGLAFDALMADRYGQCSKLVSVLASALGTTGLEQLRQRMIEVFETPVRQTPEEGQEMAGRSVLDSNAVVLADSVEMGARFSAARSALLAIADAQGDPAAFAALFDEDARMRPANAAQIACRFLKAGRAEEALQVLDASLSADGDGRGFRYGYSWERENVRVEALEAAGRTDEAQAMRWDRFERTLSESHLRAYLKSLPDFDDIEAEEKALDHARACPDTYRALSFLVSWPALDRAASLVTERVAELNGDHYELLKPAADALAARYPLAATLLLRAMIDFVMAESRWSRYRHAARHISECASLASSITDFGAFETHEAYEARLRREQKRKVSFWPMVDGNGAGT